MIDYVFNIKNKEITIYDPIDPSDHQLYIPAKELEAILSEKLVGFDLQGLPLRTRSKVVKEKLCSALGYPVPKSFKKTQPRFVGQNFDVYTQKSLNVQIWNEDIDVNRRYVFIRINEEYVVTCVRVITGDELAKYDKTGALTQKYQARMKSYDKNICSEKDTKRVQDWVADDDILLEHINPNQFPEKGQLLRISEIYKRLIPLLGQTINYLDAVQERNRGAELHSVICSQLGYFIFRDDGTYPDIANQLLEIKLQTSPTIDLGLHSPEDGKIIASLDGIDFCSQDIRYAVFDGEVHDNRVLLKSLYLVTGEDFSSYFPLFDGRKVNSKIQLSLPASFFD